MNIQWILINSLLTVIQIYIYLGIGIIAYYKKIINKQMATFISKLVAFIIFPFYNMLELSRVSTPENMKIFWILIVSTLTSLFIGFIISKLFNMFFGLDKRTSYSSSLLISLPSLGSMPLVLGKALCISGGPLDGDPRCSFVTGFLVMDLMIFQIQMFFAGYSIIVKDINLLLPFEEKLHYIWHLFLKKQGKEDIVVLDLFEKYLKDKKLANSKFKAFIGANRIVHSKGLDFEFILPTEDKPMRSVILGEEFYLDGKNYNNSNNNQSDGDHSHSLDYSALEVKPHLGIIEQNINQQSPPKARNKLKTIKLISNKVMMYYNNVFKIIEEEINNKDLQNYEAEKHKIIHNLKHFPLKFPIVRSFHISESLLKDVDVEFKHFEQTVKAIIPDFKITEYTKKSNIVIYGRVYYPPIIGCFLGLLIGLSGMRDIVFSSNHYMKNFFDAWSIITVVNVPFIYTAAGVALAATKTISRDMILTKKDILLGILIRFVIIPAIGLLWIFIWKTYYGGIVEESKVVRFAMFMPFCLPVAALVVVFFNLVNFYVEETGYQMFVQYISSLVFLTLLFLIYFITLGS
jgi:predicted permease